MIPVTPLKWLARTRLSVRTVRAITTSRALPWGLRSQVHRKVGKRSDIGDRSPFFAQPPRGRQVRFSHGPTADYLWWLGAYEPTATELFCRLAADSSLILDVGARDGVYTLFAAAANPHADVIAFEPDHEAADLLRVNCALNEHLAQRITIAEIALGCDDGRAEFYLAGGNSSLNPRFRPGSESISIAVRRGDTILAEIAPRRAVNLMKIDTESTEPDVLEGLEETVRRDRPLILCEVLPGRTEARLEAFAARHDYAVWRITEAGLERLTTVVGDRKYRQPNLLFAPSEWDVPTELALR